MKVKFKRQFFDPKGYRRRRGVWYDVPDEWRKLLPRDTEIDESFDPEPAIIAQTAKGKADGAKPAKSL